MLVKLVLAFTLIPIAEIYLLIKLGGAIGAINTILVVIVTALAGAYLARLEGLKTMMQIRGHLEQGLMPTEEMFDALLIFIAGIVLMTPGFLTDLAGLLVLIPGSRKHIKAWIKSKTSHITREKLHTIE